MALMRIGKSVISTSLASPPDNLDNGNVVEAVVLGGGGGDVVDTEGDDTCLQRGLICLSIEAIVLLLPKLEATDGLASLFTLEVIFEVEDGDMGEDESSSLACVFFSCLIR